jgi:hypothetical protein
MKAAWEEMEFKCIRRKGGKRTLIRIILDKAANAGMAFSPP